MKTICVAGMVLFATVAAAAAADMPVKAVAGAPPAFDWTGCYVGAEGGYSQGKSSQVGVAPATAAGRPITGDFNLNGGTAGGAIGCNYENSNVVFGVETDYAWTDKKGNARDLPPFNTATVSTTNEKWVDTVRGRVGYAFDRFMIYGTGGVASAGTNVTLTHPVFGVLTDPQTRTGWAAGAGGEWAALVQPWGALTVKVEYLHEDFGNQQYINPPVLFGTETAATRDVRLTDDIVRVGLNVLFTFGSTSPAPAAK